MLFSGVAGAVISETAFDIVALGNLIIETPAFAGGFATADANANWEVDDEFSKLAPYTVAQVVFVDPTGAINTRVDPSAALNMTTVAIAGLGNVDVVTANIKDQSWQSYAAAAGAADTSVTAIDSAWTAAEFDVDATVTPYSSESTAVGTSISIADKGDKRGMGQLLAQSSSGPADRPAQ